MTAHLASQYWAALMSQSVGSWGCHVDDFVHSPKSIVWSIGSYRPHTWGTPSTDFILQKLALENQYIKDWVVSQPKNFLHSFDLELEKEADYAITENKIADLQAKLTQALHMIETYWPAAFTELTAIMKSYIWYEEEGKTSKAYSSPKNFGITFLSAPHFSHVSVETLATQLVHEAAHQILFVECAIDPLIPNDYGKEVYSPFRDNMRPAIGALHALMAMARMLMWAEKIEHAKEESLRKESQIIFDWQTDLHRKAIEVLKEEVDFSPRGKDLLYSFERLQTTLDAR
ncbi:MAG: hypothetical protein KDK51_03615 [Deltaproteobacteria bacterium]|nr:hypothetical protein [Deltaproteobacteria bacterium]